MSDNVESFESFGSDQQIAAHQAGLVRVVLEGQSDVGLFSRCWFGSMRETFEFIEAGHLVAGSGCTAVRAAVAHSLNTDGVPAVGIVDRDSLFRERRWDLLFGVDDVKFAADVQTTDVYVASLWEVEAYMLDPDLFSDWVYGSHRAPPGPPAECAAALGRALSECEFLLDVASFFAAAHAEGLSYGDSHFRGQPLAAVKATCAAKLTTLSAPSQSVAAQVDALVAEVRNSQPASEAERLTFYLRYVDTKRLLIRLFHALNVHDHSQWVLPPMQSRSNRRPAELELLLKAVETRYAA
jgi:hypothetical protein